MQRGISASEALYTAYELIEESGWRIKGNAVHLIEDKDNHHYSDDEGKHIEFDDVFDWETFYTLRRFLGMLPEMKKDVGITGEIERSPVMVPEFDTIILNIRRFSGILSSNILCVRKSQR